MAWKNAVFHNPSGAYLDRLPAELGSTIRLLLRVPLDSPVEQVYLRCAPDGEQQMVKGRRLEDRVGWDCQWWECPVRLVNPKFHYRFYLVTREGGWWYNASGLSRWVPTDHTDFCVLADQYESSWLDRAVFYQIFPDRFADGDPSNNVRSGQYRVDGQPTVARSWGEMPVSEQGGREFFGGDLQGVTSRLDYLQSLGVTAVYLNPIFKAPSNHKYDVASYTEVDPHLGGDEAFLELRRALTERDMRLILDIVPNHCGSSHPWFLAAQADMRNPEFEYFSFNRYPDQYECWLGYASLPKLNYHNQSLRDAMYAGPDGVMRKWLRSPYSIDGWRVDVANMLARQGQTNLSHKVIRGMRRAVKQERPDCYFLGENFFDASSYLQGDQLDATMNYRGFMMPLYHWLTGRDYNVVFQREWGDRTALSGADLAQQWRAFRAPIPWAMARQQFNLLCGHDTPRLLNLCDRNRHHARVARLLLFTYPGVPCLYYGDEIGLEGGRDPDNRRCMNWDESTWDREWLEGWRQLIRLRTSWEALSRGSFQMLETEQHTLAFMREQRDERVLVVAKRAPDGVNSIPVGDAAVPDGMTFREELSGRKAIVSQGRLPVPEDACQLWTPIGPPGERRTTE